MVTGNEFWVSSMRSTKRRSEEWKGRGEGKLKNVRASKAKIKISLYYQFSCTKVRHRYYSPYSLDRAVADLFLFLQVKHGGHSSKSYRNFKLYLDEWLWEVLPVALRTLYCVVKKGGCWISDNTILLWYTCLLFDYQSGKFLIRLCVYQDRCNKQKKFQIWNSTWGIPPA